MRAKKLFTHAHDSHTLVSLTHVRVSYTHIFCHASLHRLFSLHLTPLFKTCLCLRQLQTGFHCKKPDMNLRRSVNCQRKKVYRFGVCRFSMPLFIQRFSFLVSGWHILGLEWGFAFWERWSGQMILILGNVRSLNLLGCGHRRRCCCRRCDDVIDFWRLSLKKTILL